MQNELSSGSITPLLTTRHLGRSFRFLEQTDSTNSAAALLAQQGAAHGTVVCTEHQTAGRGRYGRSWHSRPGQSLCFSILWRPPSPPASDISWSAWIPLASALGVATGIHRTVSDTPRLKWPNDLLFEEQKVGGLLCESSGSIERNPQFIIGIGLNVNLRRQDFPPDLRETATSIALRIGRVVDRAALLAHILNDLEARLEHVCRQHLEQIRQEYRLLCVTLGKPVRLERPDHGYLEGIARGIGDSGALLVETVTRGDGRAPEVVEVLAGNVLHLR